MSVRRVLTSGIVLAASAAAIGLNVARAAPLTVHLRQATGRVNRALAGFDFHFGGPAPTSVRALRPHFVRLDASFESLSPAPGVLNLAPLQDRVKQIRAIGGIPLVILGYTPKWLGQPFAPFGDRTRTEPTNLDTWRALVKRVVAALATGPGRVRWFEAWNEPDLPTFWAGTPASWLDTAAASAQAVHAAAIQTGLRLRFGGPASFFPDGPQIAAFVSRLRSEGLPPAFVSWHYYANYPCLGPDGPENPSDPSSVAAQRLLGCINPLASPAMYTTGIAGVRTSIASVANGMPSPLLVLDEWNLSAGGLDRRMNSNVGAAFDAATLITFQLDRLGAAAFYQATDTDSRIGGWGTVALDGARRPSWWAFRYWRALAPLTVGVVGTDASGGLWALASRNSTRREVSVLVASFSASMPMARTITLRLVGLPVGRRRAALRVIDERHDGRQPAWSVAISRAGLVTFQLPVQSVALLRITSYIPHHRR